MKTDFIYWNTFYEYLINNFKLNGDLTNDAKVIEETRCLWREVSKKYLKKVKAKNLVNMWYDIKIFSNYSAYDDLYNIFIDYLFSSSDRMNINHWLLLQMCINRSNDLVYDAWTEQYNWSEWTDKIENGWSETKSCTTKLQEDCANEFKTIIKPLIIENQKSERKTKIENEIQN